jgi:hypothetical protein
MAQPVPTLYRYSGIGIYRIGNTSHTIASLDAVLFIVHCINNKFVAHVDLTTMYVKQCDCLLALLVDDDFCRRPDKFDPLYIFQDKMKFQIFKKIFY